MRPLRRRTAALAATLLLVTLATGCGRSDSYGSIATELKGLRAEVVVCLSEIDSVEEAEAAVPELTALRDQIADANARKAALPPRNSDMHKALEPFRPTQDGSDEIRAQISRLIGVPGAIEVLVDPLEGTFSAKPLTPRQQMPMGPKLPSSMRVR